MCARGRPRHRAGSPRNGRGATLPPRASRRGVTYPEPPADSSARRCAISPAPSPAPPQASSPKAPPRGTAPTILPLPLWPHQPLDSGRAQHLGPQHPGFLLSAWTHRAFQALVSSRSKQGHGVTRTSSVQRPRLPARTASSGGFSPDKGEPHQLLTRPGWRGPKLEWKWLAGPESRPRGQWPGHSHPQPGPASRLLLGRRAFGKALE